MLIYEYKLSGTKQQYVAIDEATRIVQFIRNKSLRLWMNKIGTSQNDLQTNCSVLAKEYPFAKRLNSQARQAAADRAWFAISRFYENCKNKKPGKKGYPRFQKDNRSVEYKATGCNTTGTCMTSQSLQCHHSTLVRCVPSVARSSRRRCLFAPTSVRSVV